MIGSQQNHREYLFEALDLAASGKVKVLIETYPLTEIDKAYDRVEQGQVRFPAVIRAFTALHSVRGARHKNRTTAFTYRPPRSRPNSWHATE